MRKILISAVYFLSIGTFAQSKEQIKTWDLLLTNKRVEARNYYDKSLKETKLKEFESLFLDALIDEEMGELVFDDSFVKNFINLKVDETYLYPIFRRKFVIGEDEASLDDYSYKKIDLLAQTPTYGETPTILEYKSTFDRFRNNYKNADEALTKIKRIDKWQFAGVFENLNGSGLYNEYEPETYANNDKLFNANSFGNVGWYNRKHPSNDGFEFFPNELEYGRGIVYAQSFIENPVERKILLEVDTNAEFRLFLNDTEILSSTNDGYTNLGAHMVEVTLPKGFNRVLVKFDVKNVKNGFMIIPFDTNYQKITDLNYFDTYKNYQKSTLAQLNPKEQPLRFEAVLKEKIKQNPDSFFYKYLLTSGYLGNSQNEQAKELIDGFLKQYPKSSLVQGLLAKYYSNTEDREKVSEVFKNIELNDSEYFLVPILKMMDGDKFQDMSIKDLEKYRDILNKTKAKTMGEFFDVIIAMRNRDMAKAQSHVASLKKSFANNEKFFVIFTTLEDVEKKDQSITIKKLEDVFAQKNSPDIMDALYTYYQNANRIEDQKKLLKRYIELFPVINSFRSQYINLIDEDVQNNPEVMKEIEDALGNFPYSYSLLAAKAETLAKQNKKAEAVKFAKLSLSHNTENEEMHKLVRDLDQTEDEIDKVSVKDLYKLVAERRNKGIKSKKGVTVLLDEYITNVYPEGGIKKRSTYAYEITSDKGIEEMKEYYVDYSDDVIKSEIVKPNGNIIPGEKSEDQIVFTNLAIGDVILIQKENLERSSGRFYKDFNLSSYFNSEYPVVESIFTVITPESMNYQVKSNNKDVSSTKKKMGSKLFQTWKLNDLPELDLEENYGPSYYDATISVTANSIKTWHEIANWYADLTKKSLVSDKVVEKTFKEIFPNGTSGMTETERAEKIYNYIEKNVTYSSVDFRQSGYVPQKPSKTLITKLGDCKDLSALFVILGNQAGIKSNLVLVQTNNNSPQLLLLPNLSFNHCIVKVNLDGKETFLEMTDKYLPFNATVKSNYKAKGLVINTDKSNGGSTELIDISLDNNSKSVYRTISDVTVNGDNHNFLTKQYVMGETKSYFNDFFQEEQTEDYRKKEMEEQYGAVLDKVISVKSVKLLEGKDLTVKPLAYEVQFNVNDKPQSVGSLKIMKIPFVTKPFTKEIVATENRNTDIQYTKYERQNEYIEEIYLNIPESMKFIEIPENRSLAYNNFKYSISYELQKNNRLKITRTANTPWDNIKKEQYPEFKKFVEEAINSENQILGYK